jgi:hypothetical protein
MTESLTGEISSKEEMSQASVYIEDKWFPIRGRIKGQAYFIKMTSVMARFSGVWSLLLLLSRLRVPETLFFLGMYVVLCTALISMMCYTAQRLRDTSNKAWLAIFILVPILNLILFLCLIFAPSVVGTNTYHAPFSPESRPTKIITLALIPIALLSSAFLTTCMMFMFPLMLLTSILIAFIFYNVIINKAEDNHGTPTTLQTAIVTISIILIPIIMWFSVYLFIIQVEAWLGRPLVYTWD